MAASTGICRSAHSILRTPSGARVRSFTSCRFVVAMRRFLSVAGSGGQEPLVFALLPVERRDIGPGKPGVDGRAQVGLAPQARGEGQVAQLDAKAAAKLLERPQLVQLEQAVFPVAGRRPARNHEARALEIAQHPWR